MSDDLLSVLLRFNLALAGAIAFVLLVRTPVRRWFGARVAYALWLLPPLAAAMCFLPAPLVTLYAPATSIMPPAPADLGGAMPPTPPAITPAFLTPAAIVALWAGGVLLSLSVLALRQARFVRALGRLTRRDDLGARVFSAETSDAGPAVIGVLRPLIIAPSDFDTRYNIEERRIVLAHERAHIAQGDPLINAAAALLQCLSWFNPLIHFAGPALRTDQELACDEAVVARVAGRRTYAEALLKTHAGPTHAAPLGCAWPPASLDAFKERLSMLKRTAPTPTQLALGACAIAIATAGACALTWAAQPPRVVTITQSGAELAQNPPPNGEIGDHLEHAERDFEAERRDIEANARYLSEHREELRLTDAEIERITEAAMRNAQRDLQSTQAQMRLAQTAMAQTAMERTAQERARIDADAALNAEREQFARARALEAEKLARRDVAGARDRVAADAERVARAAEHARDAEAAQIDPAVMAEMEARGSEIAAYAARITQADLSGPALSQAEREAIETAMAVNATRLTELSAQVDASVAANMNVNVDVDVECSNEC